MYAKKRRKESAKRDKKDTPSVVISRAKVSPSPHTLPFHIFITFNTTFFGSLSKAQGTL